MCPFFLSTNIILLITNFAISILEMIFPKNNGRFHGQYILWKGSSNRDDLQFFKYQQNKQAPLIITHWTQKIPGHMTLEIQILTWGRHKNMAGLIRLMVEIKITRHFNSNSLCNSILPTFICTLYEAGKKSEDSK